VYLLRTETINPAGMIDSSNLADSVEILLPGCIHGTYAVTAWDTLKGEALARTQKTGSAKGTAYTTPPFIDDLVLAIRRLD
jgi:hypothetical protein